MQLCADKALFAHLALLAQNRAMDMCVVMGYSLGPLPWSLALPDGSLVKTNKSKLLHLPKEGVEPLHGNPSEAWIIDGMAVLQALQGRPSPFGDMAILTVQVVMSRQHVSGGLVDVVFDCWHRTGLWICVLLWAILLALCHGLWLCRMAPLLRRTSPNCSIYQKKELSHCMEILAKRGSLMAWLCCKHSKAGHLPLVIWQSSLCKSSCQGNMSVVDV